MVGCNFIELREIKLILFAAIKLSDTPCAIEC